MTEADLQNLIEQRYPAPAYATLLHVRNQTGYRRRTRTADALSMSLYPSRGLDLMGFEIKVDRSDWKRELDDPAKAEEICQYCDRWWVVVSKPEIVAPGELPPTWGLLVAQKDKLVCKVEAPKLTPKPMERHILAGILRNVTERYVPRASIADKISAAAASAFESGKESGNLEGRYAAKQLQELTKTVSEFEDASGLRLAGWDAGRIGNAVKILRGMEFSDFEKIGNMAQALADQARAAAEELKSGRREQPA